MFVRPSVEQIGDGNVDETDQSVVRSPARIPYRPLDCAPGTIEPRAARPKLEWEGYHEGRASRRDGLHRQCYWLPLFRFELASAPHRRAKTVDVKQAQRIRPLGTARGHRRRDRAFHDPKL